MAIAATGGITSDVTNNAAFQNAGTVAGSVTNNTGATFTQAGGMVANGLVNAGTVSADGGALNGVNDFTDAPTTGTTTIGAGLISAATSNVVLQAQHDINFNAAVAITQASVGLKAADIPQPLVDCQRELLKLKRAINEKRG